MKKFNQYQIKILMALLMVTDHLNHVPGLIPDYLAMIFHVLTRCVVCLWRGRGRDIFSQHSEIHSSFVWCSSSYVCR